MVMAALMALAGRAAPWAARAASAGGRLGARVALPGSVRTGLRFAVSKPVTYGGLGFGIAGALGSGAMGGGGEAPPGATAQVAYSWNTGTATFYRLGNGKIGTVKKNGVWKEWSPYKPVVIPKRWNSRSMRRVANSLDRQQEVAIKIVKMAGGDASKTKKRLPASTAAIHHAG